MKNKMKVGMVSLGCPKNEVDAEVMLHRLKAAGFRIEENPSACDIIIINTCGFIESAKKEGIDAILDAAEYKSNGQLKKLIVSGCLSARYEKDIMEEMPEVDVVLGISQYPDIVQHIEQSFHKERYAVTQLDESFAAAEGRMITTPPWRAYLKVAEGCSNRCAYCAIPSIRGNMRSRSMPDILDEARFLIDSGVKEITLVAQDTTRYGMDIGENLPKLLRKLAQLDPETWIRVLYMYPEMITDDLIDVYAEHPQICNYMDIPLQHASDFILKRMNRHSTRAGIEAMYNKLHQRIPDIALRTTYITGFPGETQAHFDELTQFIKDYPFDHVGAFSFSPEEGTPAYSMSNPVDHEVAEERKNLLLEYQSEISLQCMQKRVGQLTPVIIEDDNDQSYWGRSQHFAPEIDGEIQIMGADSLDKGCLYHVMIDEASNYDLSGHIESMGE